MGALREGKGRGVIVSVIWIKLLSSGPSSRIKLRFEGSFDTSSVVSA